MRVTTLFLLGVLLALFYGCADDVQQTEQQDREPGVNGLKALNQQLAQDSLDHRLLTRRAKLYLESGQLNKALHDINRSLEINSNNVDVYLTLAEVYFALGLPENCNTALLRALEIDRDDTRTHIKLAELSLLQQNYNMAMGYIMQALEISPYNPEAYYVRAMLYMSRKDTMRAIRSFQLALNQKEDFYEPLIQLGTIYSAEGNPLAEDYLLNAIQLFPQSLQARYQLALYYQDNNRIEDALTHYDTLLMRQPGNKHVLFNIGYVNLVYLLEYERAINYFEEALQVDPNYVEALYNKGRALEELGRLVAAREIYHEVLDKRSNYPLAIEALNRIN